MSKNYSFLVEELSVNPSAIQSKKEQTSKKIQYVTSYVEKWLYVMTERSTTTDIVFIDAMSNSGIYSDGDLGTAPKVCRMFSRFSKRHPKLKFHMYINDANEERMKSCGAICRHFSPDKQRIVIRASHLDVNDYLNFIACSESSLPQGFGTAILLFVDPYNAHTVRFGAMRAFIKNHYCEVLFNWFSSDWNRNKNSPAIKECFSDIDIPLGSDETLAIEDALRIGRMQFVFSYPFHISTGPELYQIIFITPNKAGLEKLKDALWDTFHGDMRHRNARDDMRNQPSLFNDSIVEETNASVYAPEAQRLLLDSFAGSRNISYTNISTYLLEHTLLKDGQLLRYVIKPLIEKGALIKDGVVGKANYKSDTYSLPPFA